MQQKTINCTHHFSTFQIFFTFLMWRAFSTWHCNVENFSTWQYREVSIHGRFFSTVTNIKYIVTTKSSPSSFWHLSITFLHAWERWRTPWCWSSDRLCLLSAAYSADAAAHKVFIGSNSDQILIMQTKENTPGIVLATAAGEQEVPGGVAPTHPAQDYHPDPWWSSRWSQSWWSSWWLQTWWLCRW